MTASTPAATLILWRESEPATILMVQRAATMAFAASSMVFPGGRLEADDYGFVSGDLHPSDAAARIGAIRETLEEAGIAVGIEPLPDRDTIAAWRLALSTGTPFSALLRRDGFRVDVSALTPFARWHPPAGDSHARIFDTRFYLALAPAGAEPTADGTESVRAAWVVPKQVLRDFDAGTRRIIFPTRRNLERLAGCADFRAAVADAAAYPVRLIQPTIVHRDDGDWMCIPADAGYPITEEAVAGMVRG